MNARIAVAAVLLALAGQVCAAHWNPVSVTRERSTYIDLNTLVRNGNVVQAWDWQKFGVSQTSATWQGTFYSVKSLTSYHCTQRTTDAVLKVYFGNDGVEIKRTYLEGLQFPAAVEPDSLREKMFEMACNPPKPASKRVATAAKSAVDAASSALEGATIKGDAGAAKSGPAGAEGMDGAATKAQSADAVVPRTGSTQAMNSAARQPKAGTARQMSRKESPARVRLAKGKPPADLKCPPPQQAGASKPVQPVALSPQLTDAGNDGMFN